MCYTIGTRIVDTTLGVNRKKYTRDSNTVLTRESSGPLKNETVAKNSGIIIETVYINHSFQHYQSNKVKAISITRAGVIPEMAYRERSSFYQCIRILNTF